MSELEERRRKLGEETRHLLGEMTLFLKCEVLRKLEDFSIKRLPFRQEMRFTKKQLRHMDDMVRDAFSLDGDLRGLAAEETMQQTG